MPEIYLLFLLFSFLILTGIKFFSMWLKKPKEGTLDLSQITVVIPFRNEGHNLPQLLNSLLIQKYLPKSILFVDDHSNDGSGRIVQYFIDTHQVGNLLSLPKDKTGKKEALNYGIQRAETRFVLTLDADVLLNKEYMISLSKLPECGLSALPVIMKGKGFLGKLFSTEYSFFNAFNYLLSSIWPLSISGANLLFDSKAVDYKKQLKSHQHLASGDDYFLLKEFRKKNIYIHVNNEHQLSVATDAPESIKAYFNQRVRWLGKSKFQVEWIDILIGVFILLYFIGGFIALVIAAINGQWLTFGSIFMIRFLLDALVYLNYVQRLQETKYVLMLPFFQVIYPVLFIAVAIFSLFYRPSWKGRKTE